MNEKAIRALRNKFILTSMLSLTLVMILIGGMIYLTNTALVRRQIRQALEYIIENDGEVPDESAEKEVSIDERSDADYNIVRFLHEIFGQIRRDTDISYSSYRFFSLLYDNEGQLSEIKTHNIEMISSAEAQAYGTLALRSRRPVGDTGNYYYRVGTSSSGGPIVVYIDAATQIEGTNRIMYSALSLIAIGICITLVFVRVISERAIRPEIENAELQKRFITNASHELKTPLAVIKANTEMEELLSGENEWTQSTLRQIDRLNGLIQNLVMITRVQEKEEALRTPVDITSALLDTVETFRPVAESENKSLSAQIDPGITMQAIDSEIRQLATLLLDNAIKYCDEDGAVFATASRKGKLLTFSVSNDYAAGKDVDYNRFFERFYREDTSHNVDQGGYGIGLSIAKTLVERYDGSIRCEWKDGIIKFICILKD